MVAWLTTLALTLVMTSQLVTSKPNFIILLADDFGYTDAEQHDPAMRTPNLVRLKSQGVFLNQSYVLPTCAPTRSAILTGR
jgi:arylsulfatase